MLAILKTKYNVNDDILKDIDDELGSNLLNKNKKYFIENKFNGLINDYRNTLKELEV